MNISFSTHRVGGYFSLQTPAESAVSDALSGSCWSSGRVASLPGA